MDICISWALHNFSVRSDTALLVSFSTMIFVLRLLLSQPVWKTQFTNDISQRSAAPPTVETENYLEPVILKGADGGDMCLSVPRTFF